MPSKAFLFPFDPSCYALHAAILIMLPMSGRYQKALNPECRKRSDFPTNSAAYSFRASWNLAEQ